MSKTSSDLVRRVLNGPTMGTRWSVVLFAPENRDLAPLAAALQAAVSEVDAQMSTWREESDLMRFNAAPEGRWQPLPERLLSVLDCALRIGRLSDGAFEIATGDAVAAWGFGARPADARAIRAALDCPRRPSFETLELDLPGDRARKHAPMALDLSGIAKGYGADRLVEVLEAHGISRALAAIDGELRALGPRPDGRGWAVAVERPDVDLRSVHSVLELRDIAVATSGDYRHRATVAGHEVSHTMDPRRGAPLLGGPASVTVLTQSCMEADALATAFMVLGEAGRPLAERLGVDVLWIPHREAVSEGPDAG